MGSCHSKQTYKLKESITTDAPVIYYNGGGRRRRRCHHEHHHHHHHHHHHERNYHCNYIARQEGTDQHPPAYVAAPPPPLPPPSAALPPPTPPAPPPAPATPPSLAPPPTEAPYPPGVFVAAPATPQAQPTETPYPGGTAAAPPSMSVSIRTMNGSDAASRTRASAAYVPLRIAADATSREIGPVYRTPLPATFLIPQGAQATHNGTYVLRDGPPQQKESGLVLGIKFPDGVIKPVRTESGEWARVGFIGYGWVEDPKEPMGGKWFYISNGVVSTF